jgi:hypothetical protein
MFFNIVNLLIFCSWSSQTTSFSPRINSKIFSKILRIRRKGSNSLVHSLENETHNNVYRRIISDRVQWPNRHISCDRNVWRRPTILRDHRCICKIEQAINSISKVSEPGFLFGLILQRLRLVCCWRTIMNASLFRKRVKIEAPEKFVPSVSDYRVSSWISFLGFDWFAWSLSDH